jgi:hypothetical protein
MSFFRAHLTITTEYLSPCFQAIATLDSHGGDTFVYSLAGDPAVVAEEIREYFPAYASFV